MENNEISSDSWPRHSSKGKGKGKSKRGNEKGKGKGKGNGLRWVPKQRRSSLLAACSFSDVNTKVADVLKAIGARVVDLNPASDLLGTLECLIVEPAGKRLNPKDYVTTGVVICFDGMPLSDDYLEQWCKVIAAIGWLDAGISVAIPNVQMSSALTKVDLEAVITATLDDIDYQRCVLVGKGWGALRVVELAVGEEAVPQSVEGVILAAPCSPIPEQTSMLEVPVLLLWAQDNDPSSVEEMDLWLEALDDRHAPTTVKETLHGGYEIVDMVACDGIAEVLKNFTVSSLLIANLLEEEALDEQRIDSDDEEPHHTAARLRSASLQAQLPSFLNQDVKSAELRDGEPVPEAEHVRGGMDHDRRTKKRLSLDLPYWIQGGLVTASE